MSEGRLIARWAKVDKVTGRLISSGTSSPDDIFLQPLADNEAFVALPEDVDPKKRLRHTDDGWQEIVDEPEPAMSVEQARMLRDNLLYATAWTQVADNRLNAQQRAAARRWRDDVRAAFDAVKAGQPATWPAPLDLDPDLI